MEQTSCRFLNVDVDMAERKPTVKLRICQLEKTRKEYVWSTVWELISLPTFDYEDRMTIMLCMDVERWSYVFWAVLLARSDDQNRWLSTAICYRFFTLSGDSLFSRGGECDRSPNEWWKELYVIMTKHKVWRWNNNILLVNLRWRPWELLSSYRDTVADSMTICR